MRLASEDARRLLDAAAESAAEYGKAFSFAIVDAGGYLVAVERQDGARPLTPSIAISKAYSGSVMRRPTKLLKVWAETEPTFFSQVATMGMYPIVATEGGLPVKRDGEIIGGIGISGGRPEEDQAIGEAALAAAGFELEFEQWGARK